MLNPVFKTPASHNFFFGYYDKSQLDISSTKLLAMRVELVERIPNKSDLAEIGYFDISETEAEFVSLATTRTFSWQQGAMLQWLGPNFDRHVIFNDLREGAFSSVILDVETKEERLLPMAIYTVHPTGESALCIDHERHHFCRRSYSYDGISNEDKNKAYLPNDGIWRLDLKSGHKEQIISLAQLVSVKPLSNMKGATHYVEHLMFNPSGDRFCFLHRWKMSEGGIYSRLYTANADGTDIFLLSDSGRMSHYCWRSERELLAYGGVETAANRLRKHKQLVRFIFRPLLPIFHKLFKDSSKLTKSLTGDGYVLYKDLEHAPKKVAAAISGEDGHPNFLQKNGDVFITDIYPELQDDGTSLTRLLSYDLSNDTYEVIAELRSNSSFDNTGWRCDLHPKCSFDGNYVCVDTMDAGGRGIYVFQLNPRAEHDQ